MKLYRALYNYIKLPIKIFNYWFGYYHYHKIPFDTKNALPVNADIVLIDACKKLESLNISYVIAFGTLLGIYRDNKLITHDTDLDIALFYPVKIKKIERLLKMSGYVLGQKVKTSGKTYHLSFYNKDNCIFDITFFEKIGNNYYSFCEPDFYFVFPVYLFKKKETIKFKNEKLNIPWNVEKWLEYTYGNNWKTPLHKKNSWRDDYYGMKRKIDTKPHKTRKWILKQNEYFGLGNNVRGC